MSEEMNLFDARKAIPKPSATKAETTPPPPPKEDVGIACPKCGCRDFRVIYTRPRDRMIERRRECRHCGRRITTYEKRVLG